MTGEDLDAAIEDAIDAVHEVGDDINRFTKEESAEFYEAIASDAAAMARMIRSEIL